MAWTNTSPWGCCLRFAVLLDLLQIKDDALQLITWPVCGRKAGGEASCESAWKLGGGGFPWEWLKKTASSRDVSEPMRTLLPKRALSRVPFNYATCAHYKCLSLPYCLFVCSLKRSAILLISQHLFFFCFLRSGITRIVDLMVSLKLCTTFSRKP